MFRFHLLGILKSGGPKHGYALMKEYNDRTGFTVGTGSVYRELQRLSQDGLVRSVERPEGSTDRGEPYDITDAGSAAFDEWFEAVSVHATDGEAELVARASFIGEVDPTAAAWVLTSWRRRYWTLSKDLEQVLREARRNGVGTPSRVALIERRRRHAVADLQFIEDLARAADVTFDQEEPPRDFRQRRARDQERTG